MYIRFVVGKDGENHRLLNGVITEARILRDNYGLENYQIEQLEELYEWLNENLPVPPFSTNNWSRNSISWFKDRAGEPIKKIWEIVALLKDCDVPVRMIRSIKPGRILYEDDFQIVVEEMKKL